MRAGISNIKGNLYTGGWQLIYENLLTSAATSVTISGLDGNTDKEYKLIYRPVGNSANTSHMLNFNNDTGANYNYQTLSAANDTAHAYQGAGLTGMYFDIETGVETGAVAFSEALIYAKSGCLRTALIKTAGKTLTTTVTSIYLGGWSWTNTADNITSLTISSQAANGMGIGTHILLFARRIKQTTQLEGSLELYKGKLQAGVMQTIYETTLTEAATSITISGLDGNTDILYELEMRVVNGYNGGANCLLRCNNDTGANYGRQEVNGNNATAGATRSTNHTGIYFANCDALGNVSQGEIKLYAKSGYIRTAILNRSCAIATTTVSIIQLAGYSWNNTADNITSLVILADQTNGLGIGTYIRLKALRKVV